VPKGLNGTIHKIANPGIVPANPAVGIFAKTSMFTGLAPPCDPHRAGFFAGSIGGIGVRYFANTVTIQRLSEPAPSSFTERTIPVTVAPISVNVASRPRYWA
jgi:hypothetical protein